MSTRLEQRAVVLGGSMAGLLAARVLADAYAEVTVLDRDELAACHSQRRGVPQGRHIHALLARGQQVLEDLFPGLTAELMDHGAPAGDMLNDARLYFNGHRLRQAASGLFVLSASRAFLESHVRARVRTMTRVTFAAPCDIVGLATTPDHRQVTGVRLLRRADGSAEETLGADLVVDTMGRGSRTPTWLEALGYEPPQEDRVRVDLGYATRRYRLAPDALGGDLASLHGPTPAHPRGGALARLEGDQWMLTLMGLLGDHPPTDPSGFLAFARSLQFTDIYQAIRQAEPLDNPVAFRFPMSIRRRYERLARFPEGFLVLGDSVCNFNPIYGQGMTVAALEALTLRSHLQRHPKPQPRRFFREIARVIDTPWDMATGADLAFPRVEGRRTHKLRMASTYIAQLHAAATRDARLASAFVRVSGLVDRPEALLRPGVALRVLGHRLRLPAASAPQHDGAGPSTQPQGRRERAVQEKLR
jgi:2-polyprenyl-6-methoxyphenol hydroxylase-like FAD-dependent oxidoreductase